MSGRIKLLLLTAVLVLPTLLVYLSHDGLNWRPSAHKNYGELLQPAPLPHAAGTWLDGDRAGFERTRGKWVLVYVGPAACDASCQQNLYYMRQSRILQDAARYRLELAWVLSDAGQVDDDLLKAFPELHVWKPADAAFIERFPIGRADARHVYLVDPLGNLMMRFPDRLDAKRMTQDIKLLLKGSQIG